MAKSWGCHISGNHMYVLEWSPLIQVILDQGKSGLIDLNIKAFHFFLKICVTLNIFHMFNKQTGLHYLYNLGLLN